MNRVILKERAMNCVILSGAKRGARAQPKDRTGIMLSGGFVSC